MQHIPSVNPELVQGKAKELLSAVKDKNGMVPNVFKVLAQSPAVLESFLTATKILSNGVLSEKLRQQLGVAVAGANGCDYCASAHTLMGKNAGVPDADLKINLQAKSSDTKTQAALQFARKIVETRGWTSEADLQALRSAGYDDAAIVEIIANVGMSLFTNYFNHITDTDIDFPHVETDAVRSKAA